MHVDRQQTVQLQGHYSNSVRTLHLVPCCVLTKKLHRMDPQLALLACSALSFLNFHP